MNKKVLTDSQQLQLEKDKAKNLFAYLIDLHLEPASNCKEAGVYAVSVSLKFERDAFSTKVIGKISYSRKYTDAVEEIASATEQLEVEFFQGSKGLVNLRSLSTSGEGDGNDSSS